MANSSTPKYDDLNYRYPGDFRSSEIILYSYGGSQLEISGLTAIVNIYQDLDTPFVTGNIMFFDTVGATNRLPIIGSQNISKCSGDCFIFYINWINAKWTYKSV